MKQNRIYFIRLTLVACLLALLTACSSKGKFHFIAPENEPPADLQPAYLPEGFELVSGFKITGTTPALFKVDS